MSASILWGTFGHSQRCLKRFFEMSGGHPVILQVHFSNEVCRRNRRCFEGELLGEFSVHEYNQLLEKRDPRTVEIIVRRVYQILGVVNRHKTNKTRVILSAGLEDNYSRRAYTNLYTVLREHWPYEISRNPLKSHYRGRADFLEYHGLSPKPKFPAIYNGDGAHDLGKQKKAILRDKAALSFYWEASAQGLYQQAFQRPYSRVFQVKEARRINRLMRSGG